MEESLLGCKEDLMVSPSSRTTTINMQSEPQSNKNNSRTLTANLGLAKTEFSKLIGAYIQNKHQ